MLWSRGLGFKGPTLPLAGFVSPVTHCKNQLVCLLPRFNYVTTVYLKYLFPLFQWHACKLTKLSTCVAMCKTTINRIYFYVYILLPWIMHTLFSAETGDNRKYICVHRLWPYGNSSRGVHIRLWNCFFALSTMKVIFDCRNSKPIFTFFGSLSQFEIQKCSNLWSAAE